MNCILTVAYPPDETPVTIYKGVDEKDVNRTIFGILQTPTVERILVKVFRDGKIIKIGRKEKINDHSV